MLEEFINDRIMVKDSVNSWEEAIKIASEPMLRDGLIEERYIDGMIKNVIENGTYIIILPGLAIPHTRPELGAKKTGVSVLKINEGVLFPDDKEVKIMFVLSAKDAEAHLDMVSELTEVFMDDEIMDKVFESKDAERIKEILC